MSLKFSIYFTFKEHINSDLPHFRYAIATCDCFIGQGSLVSLLFQHVLSHSFPLRTEQTGKLLEMLDLGALNTPGIN